MNTKKVIPLEKKQKRENPLFNLLRTADSITEPRPLNWMWNGLIYRGAITLFDGLGGTGKSKIAIQIGINLLLKTNFFGLENFRYRNIHNQIEKVLYLAAEDPEEIIENRIYESFLPSHQHFSEEAVLSAKKKFKHINFYVAENIDSSLINSTGEKTITYSDLEELITTEKPTLLIVDSLINFYGADENVSAMARKFYQLLNNLKVTVLLLHHQNKEGQKDNGNGDISSRGSIVFREQSRTRLILKNSNIYINKMNYSNSAGKIINLKWQSGIFVTTGVEDDTEKTGTWFDDTPLKKQGRPRGTGKKLKEEAEINANMF